MALMATMAADALQADPKAEATPAQQLSPMNMSERNQRMTTFAMSVCKEHMVSC